MDFAEIILLGAGLDMLSVSLPERDTTIIEVDHPATQRAKLEALRGDPSVDSVVSIGVDLASTSLRRALKSCRSFDSGKDTLFVAEGVFMYLPPKSVDAVFESMREASMGRARVLLSVVSPDARGRLRLHSQSRAVDLCMALLGETFTWGLRPNDVADFMSARGWSLDGVHSTNDLRARFLGPGDAAQVPDTGEALVVATALR